MVEIYPPASVPPPEAYPAAPPPGKRSCLWIPVVALVGLGCLLVLAVALGYYFLILRPVTQPVVLIHSPQQGERVEIGQAVTVRSVARDEQKIARVELWADGQLQRAESSNLPGGTSPFPLLVDWQPVYTGTHTLLVRAFNSRGGRGQASVDVQATGGADRDNDGVADDVDACPDEPGTLLAHGCPDRDGDGIADASDACPDQAGLPENGCPAPSEGDRDGDGVLDAADACPDEAGSPAAEGCPDADGDGVRDSEDACPHEPGLAEDRGCPVPGDTDGDGVADAADACPTEPGSPGAAGCPDRDGDGVRDSEDACPDVAGLPELAGCPDRDGDGVRDADDACPDVPGPAELHGCPASGAGDRDGDGVPDDADSSPDEPGHSEDGGGPAPGGGGDDAPGDAWDGVDPGLFFFAHPFIAYVPVEFQALEFEVDRSYDEVYAYAGLAGSDMERYGPFDPLGARRWDIAAVLGGEHSVHLMVPAEGPLEVRAESGAYDIFHVPGGEEATLWDLGSFVRSHPPADWDGHIITARSEGGADGRWFQARYRICGGSCEAAALPPPALTLLHGGGDHRLIWIWDGDRSTIDGFRLYVDDHPMFTLARDKFSHSVRYFDPPCGDRLKFSMTAYLGSIESPPSNAAYWTGTNCTRIVRVMFETLRTGDLGEDQGGRHTTGPIDARFWASSSGDPLSLEYHTSVYHWGWHGFYLRPNYEQSIQGMFDWVDTEMASCIGNGCVSNEYSAPRLNYVDVYLGQYDDLTFGGFVEDHDIGSEDTLFEAQRTLSGASVLNGEFTLHNRNIDLIVRVQERGRP